MTQQASIGRIVHFYDPRLGAQGFNGVGQGPYAAVVTQVFYEGIGDKQIVSYANLKVFHPFSEDMHIGSIPEQSSGHHYEGGPYWVWPPKV